MLLFGVFRNRATGAVALNGSGGSNPVKNPSFEDGTKSWSTFGSTIFTADPTHVMSGSSSAKVVTDNLGTGAEAGIQQTFNLNAGPVSFIIGVQTDTAQTIQFRATVGVTQIQSSLGTNPGTNLFWELDFDAPTTGSYLLQLYSTTSDTFWIDQIKVRTINGVVSQRHGSTSLVGSGSLFTLGKVGNHPNPGSQMNGFGVLITRGKVGAKDSTQLSGGKVYSVRETATNATGSNTLTRTNYITSGTASATITTNAGTTGPKFDSSSLVGSGTITTDGGNTSGHLYSVRLTASNGGGSDTFTRTGYISVGGGSVPSSCALIGSGTITTVPTVPNIDTWSVRLTAINASGSNTFTRTNYINVTQSAPAAHLDGDATILVQGVVDNKASTSLVGTATIFTTFRASGTTRTTGVGTITTTAKVGVKVAGGGWGTNWGTSWGVGAVGVSIVGTGTITTGSSGHFSVFGASSTVGTGTITTTGKLLARVATSTVGTGTLVTSGTYRERAATSLIASGNIVTVGGALPSGNTTRTVGVGTITTGPAKEKVKAFVVFIGSGSITITPPQHGNLTELPAFSHDLTEFPDIGGVLVGAGAGSAKNLSEIPADTLP